jgi:hypothetical protein
MVIKVVRDFFNDKCTLSTVTIPGLGVYQFLEDPVRRKKIKGETAFNAGTYPLIILKQDTPMTLRYRNKHDWFTHFIEVDELVGWDLCYLHSGNYPKDTEGCPLMGKTRASLGEGNMMVTRSVEAMKEIYEYLTPILESGKKVWWEVTQTEDYFAS